MMGLSQAYRKPPWTTCKWSDEGSAVASRANSKNVDLRYILVGGIVRGRVASTAIFEGVDLQQARSRSWALPRSSSGGGDASDGRVEKDKEDSKTKTGRDDCFDYVFPASKNAENDAPSKWGDADPAVASTAKSADIDLQQARSSSRSLGLPSTPSDVGVAGGGRMEKSREEVEHQKSVDDFSAILNDAPSKWGDADPAVASTAKSADIDLQQARSSSRSLGLPSTPSDVGVAGGGRMEKSREEVEHQKSVDDFSAILNDAPSKWGDADPAVASTAKSADIDLQQARSSSRSWGLPSSPSVRVASDGGMEKRREEAKMETEPDDVLSALNDAQSVIHKIRRRWHATESATRDEKKRLEAERDNERKLLNDTRIVLQERVTDVAALERRVDVVFALVTEKNTEIRSMRKAAKVDREKRESEFDAFVNAMRLKQEKLEEERDEVKQKAGSVTRSLERERDAAMIALAEKKAEMVRKCDENVELSKRLIAALCKKRKLEQDLIVMGNERAEDKTKLEQEHKTKLKRSRNDSSRLKVKLLAVTSKKTELEAELVSMGNEKNRLESDRGTIQRKLEEEEEKLLCTICLECPKDTIVLPCLHLQFCSTCLEKHKKENESCPACRTSIKGVLRCHV